MNQNITELWFAWFYKNWEKFCPGDLIDKGLSASKVAEIFLNQKDDEILKLAKEFDETNYDALNQFMKLSESELHILKYFLKSIKSKKL